MEHCTQEITARDLLRAGFVVVDGVEYWHTEIDANREGVALAVEIAGHFERFAYIGYTLNQIAAKLAGDIRERAAGYITAKD